MTPGVKLSKRLAMIAASFIAILIAMTFAWPHLHFNTAAVPVVPVTHFAPPPPTPLPTPIPTPSMTILPHTQAQASSTATPRARATPCQPCTEAANEVLARYLHAIRDGAGDDDSERRNVYEAPQIFPNQNHPVYVPATPSNE
jgi:hypothetical protein